MMNFKTIKKAGLSALLAGTFAFAADESVAAPVLKDPESITLTAKQADRKMKRTFAEQEKLLSTEQLGMWEKIKKHRDFPQLFPEIKMNLDITKISKNENYIFVPYEERDGKRHKSITLYWHNSHDSIKVIFNHRQILEDYQSTYVVPTHEVPDFVKDKSDCYFYTSKVQLEKLSEPEKEFIQTLDTCLNKNYNFLYARGFADIDEAQLAEGKLAGYLYQTHRLSKREEKGFRPVRFGNTPLEIKINRHIGAPMSVEEIAKTSGFYYLGGCEGEAHFSTNQTDGIFCVPWAKDISKDKKLISHTYAQAEVRQKQAVLASIKILDEGMKEIVAEGLPGATQEFTNLLNEKQELVSKYNRQLSKHVRLAGNSKMPNSLAHTHALDKYLTDNFNQKVQDGIEPVKVTHQSLSDKTVIQKKNYGYQR